jgi:Ni/Co efflux regulator RcnB
MIRPPNEEIRQMKRFLMAICAAAIVAGGAGVAQADTHHDNHDNHDTHNNNNNGNNNNNWHSDWRVGHRMDNGDWQHGDHVDWHQHHLRAPPRGYEWREVDGNYVLAAVATGLIASIIANSH